MNLMKQIYLLLMENILSINIIININIKEVCHELIYIILMSHDYYLVVLLLPNVVTVLFLLYHCEVSTNQDDEDMAHLDKLQSQ